ncbi:MAG: hypothetical protein KJZ59_05840, partial [Pararhodobacter sp.]|nr:hypothetical protein [Pararhodobacter sp.]
GEETLSAVTLPEALENWRDVGDNPQLWADVAALVQPGAKQLSPVTGVMTLADGEKLFIDARRTTTGALMIAFSQSAEMRTAPEVTSRAGQRAQILRASA